VILLHILIASWAKTFISLSLAYFCLVGLFVWVKKNIHVHGTDTHLYLTISQKSTTLEKEKSIFKGETQQQQNTM
jgi:hypothetical protein